MPAPLPDADALRRTVLAASWQRDRRVGRRRLAWRYLQWFALRAAIVSLPLAGLYLLLSRPADLLAPPPEPGPPGLVLRLDLLPTVPAARPPSLQNTPQPTADPSSNPSTRKAP